jgi:hypothetical protein
MATTKTTPKPEAAQEDAPQVVTLRCEALGKTKDFTPKHAKDLLELQAARRLKDWAPVTAEVTTTDNA